MKVAISQPEHFPYIGYFQKMVSCDLFIILDNVQFSGPRSFQNRNCYTNKFGNKQWFTVPVARNSYYERIDRVMTAPDFGWRKKLIRTMEQNFSNNIDFVKIYSHDSLININLDAINICRTVLSINTPMIRSSSINVEGSKANLIYNICKEVGATEYISGQGALSYLKDINFNGIKITFLNTEISNMDSIVTYLCNNEKVKKADDLLQSFRI